MTETEKPSGEKPPEQMTLAGWLYCILYTIVLLYIAFHQDLLIRWIDHLAEHYR
jgi:hypothetical protein